MSIKVGGMEEHMFRIVAILNEGNANSQTFMQLIHFAMLSHVPNKILYYQHNRILHW